MTLIEQAAKLQKEFQDKQVAPKPLGLYSNWVKIQPQVFTISDQVLAPYPRLATSIAGDWIENIAVSGAYTWGVASDNITRGQFVGITTGNCFIDNYWSSTSIV